MLRSGAAVEHAGKISVVGNLETPAATRAQANGATVEIDRTRRSRADRATTTLAIHRRAAREKCRGCRRPAATRCSTRRRCRPGPPRRSGPAAGKIWGAAAGARFCWPSIRIRPDLTIREVLSDPGVAELREGTESADRGGRRRTAAIRSPMLFCLYSKPLVSQTSKSSRRLSAGRGRHYNGGSSFACARSLIRESPPDVRSRLSHPSSQTCARPSPNVFVFGSDRALRTAGDALSGRAHSIRVDARQAAGPRRSGQRGTQRSVRRRPGWSRYRTLRAMFQARRAKNRTVRRAY